MVLVIAYAPYPASLRRKRKKLRRYTASLRFVAAFSEYREKPSTERTNRSSPGLNDDAPSSAAPSTAHPPAGTHPPRTCDQTPRSSAPSPAPLGPAQRSVAWPARWSDTGSCRTPYGRGGGRSRPDSDRSPVDYGYAPRRRRSWN